MLFLLVPYGYIIIKIRIPKEMTVLSVLVPPLIAAPAWVGRPAILIASPCVKLYKKVKVQLEGSQVKLGTMFIIRGLEVFKIRGKGLFRVPLVWLDVYGEGLGSSSL